MGMTINRRYRDALYDGLMTDLTAHGDIFTTYLRNDEATPRSSLGRAIRATRRELHLAQQTVADLIVVSRVVVNCSA
jgi:hypothetical protein